MTYRTPLPQGLAKLLRKPGKLDVEADAHSFLLTPVGVNRVLQVGGKDQQCALLHTDHNLVGIFARKFHHGGSNDPDLIARVMEVDGVRTRQARLTERAIPGI